MNILTSSALAITPVRSKADLAAFVELPHRVYGHDRNWVTPLRSDLQDRLDPRANPFFDHAVARYFLASRAGRVVGRISAHVDERYNRFHARGGEPDATGFWGFFECEDDRDAALGLFDAAGGWLASHGMRAMVGPASFTLNDEAGLLIDGFGTPPMIQMTYNPPYYEPLVEAVGFTKVQDLWAYRLDTSVEPPADLVAFGRTAMARFTFRTIRMSDFGAEIDRFLRVYNEAWERNWGFCPMTEAEIRMHAKDLKPIIDPALVIVAEEGSETVAVGLTVPNVNEAIIRMRGRYRPLATARLLWQAKRCRWEACRVFALGVRPGYRDSGVGAHLYVETLAAARRGGYRWGEMSWILESNDAMNRAIRHMGGTVYKTYRMYGRPLA
jgi:GNAT superfamily N-acetyltransferase